MLHGRDRARDHHGGRLFAGAIALLLVSVCLASDTSARGSTRSTEAQSAGSGLGRFYQQPVNWRTCQVVGEQCADLTVPLDYSVPAGRTITIAIDRFLALKPDAVIGSLFVNPGGPGGSGIDLARSLTTRLPAEIRNQFDLVGFDPRGVGRSTPVECPNVTPPPPLAGTYPPAPATAAERVERIGVLKQGAANCEKGSGWLLPYVGTVNTARDMDVIRAAIGANTINYLGFSYGSLLGAVYATLYPRQLRTMVLDGPEDPTLGLAVRNHDKAVAFSKDLDDFLAWCVARDDCPLGTGDLASARQDLSDLIDSASAHPMTTDLTLTASSSGHRHLTGGQLLAVVLNELYVTTRWTGLEDALSDAIDDDGTALLQLDDQLNHRDTHGKYLDNEGVAISAIRCADTSNRVRTEDEVRRDATAWSTDAPLVAGLFAWDELDCTWWPTPTPAPVSVGSAPGQPPILVVAATGDPATPYTWGQGLVRQLPTARLLTRAGDGHTSYLRGSTCIDAAVNAYLLGGTLPALDTTCASAALPGVSS